MPGDTVLQIENVTRSFGATPVLSGVTFSLGRGKILGLAGENGAGKSTLARLISGRLKPDSGSITLNGNCYVLPQEFALIPTLSVCENIFLGRELSSLGMLRRSEMMKRANELFERLHVHIDPARMASTLSVAEKQMTELAKAFLDESGLLILDEPTTVLSKAEVDRLFGELFKLRDAGTSIIFVSHKLPEMLALCDEIAVLRDGVLISHEPAAGMTPADIARKMVGRNFSQSFPEKHQPSADAPVRFRAENIASADGMVKNVSFEIRRGEILGLAGLAGAGRTELAETICGLRKRASGKITLDDREIPSKSTRKIYDAGISYLSEDRQGTALLTGEPLRENMSLSSLVRKYCSFGIVRENKRTVSAREYIRIFRIKCESEKALVASLSGGNQQKVALAKGLDTDPKFFIFDEPTRGVDVGARREIYDFIHSLAAQGVSCLLISSDMEELIGNCTRILVMHEGCLRGNLTGSELTEEEIIYHATGVK